MGRVEGERENEGKGRRRKDRKQSIGWGRKEVGTEKNPKKPMPQRK